MKHVVSASQPFVKVSWAILVIAVVFSIPVFALIYIATTGDLESFGHFSRTVLPRATYTTASLMIGVGLMVAIVGTATAWLISYFEFPGRRLFQWLLMMPLAVPTYVSAYAFVEFFSFTGSLQTGFRSITGYETAQQYWFPDIRTTGGSVFVFSAVLYPYVYLAVRSLFHFQGSDVIESARVLGASGARLFFKVTLPLARPAVAIGIALALMEVINDIGAVEHLGTRTLTQSIFSVWLNQNDLPGAAQMALLLLVIVVGLLAMEHYSRKGRKFYSSSRRRFSAPPHRSRLRGLSSITAFFACLVPVMAGFGVPLYVIGGYAAARITEGISTDLLQAFIYSVTLASVGAAVTVIIGLYFAYKLRSGYSNFERVVIRIACSGYALPGTLVALGALVSVAHFENVIDSFARENLGFSTGLFLSGSGAILVYAYAIRFLTISEGNLTSGLRKISPNLDLASRTLGRSRNQTLKEVLLPLMNPAIITAGLLVFMEIMKELSATILLRPFGLSTLATHVYDLAARSRIEDAAMGCLLIILSGLVPVLILLRSQERH